MMLTKDGVALARFYGDQNRALRHLLRTVRHEMATPLSGALLHVEVASRRLARGEGAEPAAVVEGLRTIQGELERTAALLDFFGEIAVGTEEEPRDFSISEAVSRGAAAYTPEDGVVVALARPEAEIFGAPRQLEEAIAETTRILLASGKAVEWKIEALPSEIRLLGSAPGDLAGGAESAFRIGRTPEDFARALALVRLRFVVEGHGGALELSRDGSHVRLAASFPRAGA
jgi:hypothetical protein